MHSAVMHFLTRFYNNDKKMRKSELLSKIKKSLTYIVLKNKLLLSKLCNNILLIMKFYVVKVDMRIQRYRLHYLMLN